MKVDVGYHDPNWILRIGILGINVGLWLNKLLI